MDKFFGLTENKTNVKTEILAGITTFVTMAYIIFVNPSILSETGMDAGAVFVATCLAAVIGTLIMGLYANIPFAQAPGMGLNAFFTYSVVSGMGYTWQQALAAVFISGLLFILLTVTGLRKGIVDALPMSLKYAISGGIGLFIALIGLINGHIIVSNEATVVGFGDFTDPKTILAIIGLIITSILMARKVKGSIILGIIITTLIGVPMGIVDLTGFSPVSLPPSLAPTFMKMDFAGLLKTGGELTVIGALVNVITVIISFSLVDMFDTIGTLVGTASNTGLMDENGNVKNMEKALLADAVATSAGAVLGTSTTTTFVESAAGVSEGGRTGLTSVTVAVLFLLALFFSPLVGIIPGEATAPALMVVGVLMVGSITKINFQDFTEALPAFFTIAIMPFSYSIANGIAAGMILYPLTKISVGEGKEVHPAIYVLAILFILRFTVFPH
ncbi:MAG: NCS2 family permease [Clostridia bacterium]|nr:NCS2 family permease [Clostridia bacterium]